jgi:hypothetical protein
MTSKRNFNKSTAHSGMTWIKNSLIKIIIKLKILIFNQLLMSLTIDSQLVLVVEPFSIQLTIYLNKGSGQGNIRLKN